MGQGFKGVVFDGRKAHRLCSIKRELGHVLLKEHFNDPELKDNCCLVSTVLLARADIVPSVYSPGATRNPVHSKRNPRISRTLQQNDDLEERLLHVKTIFDHLPPLSYEVLRLSDLEASLQTGVRYHERVHLRVTRLEQVLDAGGHTAVAHQLVDELKAKLEEVLLARGKSLQQGLSNGALAALPSNPFATPAGHPPPLGSPERLDYIRVEERVTRDVLRLCKQGKGRRDAGQHLKEPKGFWNQFQTSLLDEWKKKGVILHQDILQWRQHNYARLLEAGFQPTQPGSLVPVPDTSLPSIVLYRSGGHGPAGPAPRGDGAFQAQEEQKAQATPISTEVGQPPERVLHPEVLGTSEGPHSNPGGGRDRSDVEPFPVQGQDEVRHQGGGAGRPVHQSDSELPGVQTTDRAGAVSMHQLPGLEVVQGPPLHAVCDAPPGDGEIQEQSGDRRLRSELFLLPGDDLVPSSAAAVVQPQCLGGQGAAEPEKEALRGATSRDRTASAEDRAGGSTSNTACPQSLPSDSTTSFRNTFLLVAEEIRRGVDECQDPEVHDLINDVLARLQQTHLSEQEERGKEDDSGYSLEENANSQSCGGEASRSVSEMQPDRSLTCISFDDWAAAGAAGVRTADEAQIQHLVSGREELPAINLPNLQSSSNTETPNHPTGLSVVLSPSAPPLDMDDSGGQQPPPPATASDALEEACAGLSFLGDSVVFELDLPIGPQTPHGQAAVEFVGAAASHRDSNQVEVATAAVQQPPPESEATSATGEAAGVATASSGTTTPMAPPPPISNRGATLTAPAGAGAMEEEMEDGEVRLQPQRCPERPVPTTFAMRNRLSVLLGVRKTTEARRAPDAALTSPDMGRVARRANELAEKISQDPDRMLVENYMDCLRLMEFANKGTLDEREKSAKRRCLMRILRRANSIHYTVPEATNYCAKTLVPKTATAEQKEQSAADLEADGVDYLDQLWASSCDLSLRNTQSRHYVEAAKGMGFAGPGLGYLRSFKKLVKHGNLAAPFLTTFDANRPEPPNLYPFCGIGEPAKQCRSFATLKHIEVILQAYSGQATDLLLLLEQKDLKDWTDEEKDRLITHLLGVTQNFGTPDRSPPPADHDGLGGDRTTRGPDSANPQSCTTSDLNVNSDATTVRGSQDVEMTSPIDSAFDSGTPGSSSASAPSASGPNLTGQGKPSNERKGKDLSFYLRQREEEEEQKQSLDDSWQAPPQAGGSQPEQLSSDGSEREQQQAEEREQQQAEGREQQQPLQDPDDQRRKRERRHDNDKRKGSAGGEFRPRKQETAPDIDRRQPGRADKRTRSAEDVRVGRDGRDARSHSYQNRENSTTPKKPRPTERLSELPKLEDVNFKPPTFDDLKGLRAEAIKLLQMTPYTRIKAKRDFRQTCHDLEIVASLFNITSIESKYHKPGIHTLPYDLIRVYSPDYLAVMESQRFPRQFRDQIRQVQSLTRYLTKIPNLYLKPAERAFVVFCPEHGCIFETADKFPLKFQRVEEVVKAHLETLNEHIKNHHPKRPASDAERVETLQF